MITDVDGNQLDDATALSRIVAALDRRFPHHNTPGDRLGRLLEEIGELAEVILVIEHATPSITETEAGAGTDGLAAATKELQDILRAAGGIAHHYQLPTRLPGPSDHLPSGNPYLLLTRLVQAGGLLAEAVHHMAGMGMKRDKHGDPTADRLTMAVDRVIIHALTIAEHYQLRDALRDSIQTYYRNYQRDGFLPLPADES